jgi:sugar transferase (PEP-CTERM/EpsH1 system associated)
MKILWLKSDFLYPADTGGKIRSYNILRQLAGDHEVSYLCLTDETPSPEAIDHLGSFCKRVDYIPFKPERKFSPEFYLAILRNLFSSRPYVINKYKNSRIVEEIKKRVASGKVDVLLCDFLEMSVNLADIRGVPMVLFQHNVETEIWRRHFETNENPLKKGYLYIDYRRFYKYEKMACGWFDDVLVVSEADGGLLRENYDVKHTTIIPTGVDTEYFKPNPGLMEPKSIAFVGSMDWLPNQDAVEYFVGEIYPKIKTKVTDVRFCIVGRRPPEKIMNLAKLDSSVTVTGTVDDIRPYVDKARVYIVPIRIGGGTRIKIYEALAQKKAIISTAIGAEGLPLVDGKHIIIADDPERFADAVIRLLNDDDDLGMRISENGYSLVKEKYSWEKVAGSFSRALQEVVNLRRGKVAVGGSAGEL